MMAISNPTSKTIYIDGNYVLKLTKELKSIMSLSLGVTFTMQTLEGEERKHFQQLPIGIKNIPLSQMQFDCITSIVNDWNRPNYRIDKGEDYLKGIRLYGFDTTGIRATKNYATDVVLFTSGDDEKRDYTLEDVVGILVGYNL